MLRLAANHYSHDLDFKILLDPGQQDLLGPENDDSLPIEWEAGVRPWEKTRDGADPNEGTTTGPTSSVTFIDSHQTSQESGK